MNTEFDSLCRSIRACDHCAAALDHQPRPVFQVSRTARILIAGQAPGRKVHETGVPFDDPSGDRLRDWMGVSADEFYDADKIAILPMGFCYPGKGKSGDQPPRPECASLWREQILAQMESTELTLLIGKYAMDWHFRTGPKQTLTDRIRNWRENYPEIIPLPHPSPRNNIWLKKNAWFQTEVLVELPQLVRALL